MENNLILEGLLSMVTELKERQEKQVTPASREETINRLDVIEQRISEMQGKSSITENTVQDTRAVRRSTFVRCSSVPQHRWACILQRNTCS